MDEAKPVESAVGAPQPGPEGAAARRRPWKLYLMLGAVGVLASLAGAVYVWKQISVRGLEQRLAEERNQSSSARRQALALQARDLLRLTARPLAWSVRAELLRGNLGQIDDYFREFVRERGVSALVLVDGEGKIALATNRKLETQPADSVLPKALLDAPDVTVVEAGSQLRLGVPIMGFDRRLGTLVVDYDLEGP